MTQDKARTSANQQQLVADWEISPSSERHIQREWEKEKKQKFKLNYNAQEKTKGDSWQVRASVSVSVCVCVQSTQCGQSSGEKRGSLVDKDKIELMHWMLCEQMKTNTEKTKSAQLRLCVCDCEPNWPNLHSQSVTSQIRESANSTTIRKGKLGEEKERWKSKAEWCAYVNIEYSCQIFIHSDHFYSLLNATKKTGLQALFPLIT